MWPKQKTNTSDVLLTKFKRRQKFLIVKDQVHE